MNVSHAYNNTTHNMIMITVHTTAAIHRSMSLPEHFYNGLDGAILHLLLLMIIGYSVGHITLDLGGAVSSNSRIISPEVFSMHSDQRGTSKLHHDPSFYKSNSEYFRKHCASS